MSGILEAPQVYLVGAGPGDPDLLTVKAQRILQKADFIVYDRLVGEDILDLAPAEASRIFVGKMSGSHAMPQDRINSLLVGLARPGRIVVRLKGGDPFIFGRGSEEAETLRGHDIPYEVVPGITAASGCLAEIGVPLTHRGMATGVRMVTGHCREDEPLNLNWRSLADPDTTLVLYMALANLPEIRARLIAAGLPADTPAVAVSGGTTRHQRMCRSTLGSLPEDIASAGLKAPTLVVIGRVASFARSRRDTFSAGAGDLAALVLREIGHA